MSSGLSVGAKNNPTLLHTRLKQAAFCIARLSKEKQQLIEMGNRLRAQITVAGLKGTTADCSPHHHSRKQTVLLTTCVVVRTLGPSNEKCNKLLILFEIPSVDNSTNKIYFMFYPTSLFNFSEYILIMNVIL